MKLFIGNIAYATTDTTLRSAFEKFGNILSCKIATDRETGRSRGFGFIEFSDRAQAMEAMEAMNGTSLDGKQLVVNEAKPKTDRAGGSGGGGYSSGGSRGGYAGGRY